MSELPSGWAEAPLIDLLSSLESGSRPRGGVRGIEEGVPSIGGEHIDSNGGFKTQNVRYVPFEFARRMARGHLNTGDILVVKDGATTGKVALVGPNFPYTTAVVNEHVFVCRTWEGLDPKYVFYFLFSDDGQQRILRNFRGSAQGGIPQGFAEHTSIPVPPSPEQARIVAAIEAQFSRIDAGKAGIARARQNLKRMRAAVLEGATSGRLAQATQPDGWIETPLGDLLKDIQAGRSFKCDERPAPRDEWGVIRVSAMTWGEFRENENKTVLPGHPIDDRMEIHPGDILLSRANTVEYVGAVVQVGKCRPRLLLSDKSLRLVLAPEVLPEWLLIALRSSRSRRYIEALATGTSDSMRNISQAKLRALPVPLPPISIQASIAQEVDRLNSLIAALEQALITHEKSQRALSSSLLAAAFRGRLVPQDPHEEHANILLERLSSGIGRSNNASHSSTPSRGAVRRA